MGTRAGAEDKAGAAGEGGGGNEIEPTLLPDAGSAAHSHQHQHLNLLLQTRAQAQAQVDQAHAELARSQAAVEHAEAQGLAARQQQLEDLMQRRDLFMLQPAGSIPLPPMQPLSGAIGTGTPAAPVRSFFALLSFTCTSHACTSRAACWHMMLCFLLLTLSTQTTDPLFPPALTS